ncbi:MAG: heme o synthase [Methylococcaceae bacterium]
MSNQLSQRPPVWKCYLLLCKSNVVIEMVFTAIVGMLLAMPTLPPLALMFYASLGIALAASSAAAINHVVDREIDKVLNKHRPIPMGYLTAKQATVFAIILGLLAMLILIVWVNLLTALLTFLSMIGYAIIYTKYLKPRTSQNIVIGGAFGATPPLLGWCAITNSIHPHALLLVLIIFVWTPPHFWPLTIARIEKYQEIYTLFKIPQFPITHGIALTCLHSLLYTILLFIVTLLPYLTGMSGLIYLVSIMLCNLGFLYFIVVMQKNPTKKNAMAAFWYSIVYVTLLFAILLVDHYFFITA